MDSQYTELYYEMQKKMGYKPGDKPSADLAHIAAPSKMMTELLASMATKNTKNTKNTK